MFQNGIHFFVESRHRRKRRRINGIPRKRRHAEPQAEDQARTRANLVAIGHSARAQTQSSFAFYSPQRILLPREEVVKRGKGRQIWGLAAFPLSPGRGPSCPWLPPADI